ncbi:hypothetical protein C7S14_0104 [Burkholderia cepacia]|nr:hypothetical protein C7S14_0104 [Burkholderia cepacia]
MFDPVAFERRPSHFTHRSLSRFLRCGTLSHESADESAGGCLNFLTTERPPRKTPCGTRQDTANHPHSPFRGSADKS